MKSLKDIFSGLGSKLFSRTPMFIGLGLLLLLGIWGIFRACSGPDILVAPSIFVIARDTSWYPLQLGDKDKNITAFSSELLLDIANKENFRYDLDNVGSTLLFSDLDNGDYDAILASTTPTAWNKQKYQFSDPFYLVGPVLIVPIDSAVTSIIAMEGKTLGIRSGSSVVFNIARFPSITIIPYDNINQALDNLRDNQIDGVVLPALIANLYVKTFYSASLKIATKPLTDEGLRLITRKESRYDALISMFNKGLKDLRISGVYDQVLDKWTLPNPEKLEDHSNHEHLNLSNH